MNTTGDIGTAKAEQRGHKKGTAMACPKALEDTKIPEARATTRADASVYEVAIFAMHGWPNKDETRW